MSYTSTNEYTEVTVNKSLQSYYKHRDKRIEIMRDNRNTQRIRASSLVSGAKKRAAKAGLVFELDTNWVADKLEQGVCEVTGIRFELTSGRNPFAPSLDRTNPELGYTKENTKVVVWCYNTAKGGWKHSDVIILAEALCGKNIH